jgi:hypothetical protein
MSGFDAAFSEFRDQAAKQLGVPSGNVDVTPAYEESFKLPMLAHLRIGKLWQLEGTSDRRVFRGWINSDRVLVTAHENLGLLFQEAGTWTTTPTLKPAELADRITWALGSEYIIAVGGNASLPEPHLQLAADGSGALKFFVSHRFSGPGGGAGGGPREVYECNVALASDHKAELKMKKVNK